MMFWGLFVSFALLCSAVGTVVDVIGHDQTSFDLSSHVAPVQFFALSHIFCVNLTDPDLSASFVSFPFLLQSGMVESASAASVTKTIRLARDDTHVDSMGRQKDASQQNRDFQPNVTDKETVINLAMMTADAYYLNASDPGWHNLTQGFKDSCHFGFDNDGLRGHVFSNEDNSIAIVAFKGSSIDPRDTTRNKDRLNDNVLFSCCCGAQRPDPYWYGEVCSCRQDVYSCNSTCLTTELRRDDRYYAAAKSVMHNVTQNLFPSTTIWTTGHSLGGALASLMGMTFDIPATSFEAPPDRLAARRLGLTPDQKEMKQKSPPTYHFGNTADPVYMGACNGFFSFCAAAGYAFESQCFTGKRCMYDTMGDKGWRLGVASHRIDTVIKDVLRVYDKVPECIDEDEECTDCFNWRFQ